jgi:hypothetical protein
MTFYRAPIFPVSLLTRYQLVCQVCVVTNINIKLELTREAAGTWERGRGRKKERGRVGERERGRVGDREREERGREERGREGERRGERRERREQRGKRERGREGERAERGRVEIRVQNEARAARI